MNVIARTVAHFAHRWILRSRRVTARVPEHDLRLRVSPADVIGRHLYEYRRYEPELAATLAHHLDLGSAALVVDVGANVGWYSLLVSRLSQGRCRVFAFEPDPDNFDLLQTNLALDGTANVTPFNLALGESAATLKLHRYGSGNAGRHSLVELHAGDTVPVEVVALDDLWRARNLPAGPIRLLKMDIEGYEVFALRGARAVLSRCEWLLLEHSPAYLARSGAGIDALVGLLLDAGFRPFVPRGAAPPQPVEPAELLADPVQRDVLWRRC
jgi:FkbM family methyltransferase